ncbi:MAG: DUF1501 domain-containing protein [Oceanospirillaceae bacterium]|nr:DUF1501 domain-containing protein [Oceanospirillaceae bacterium]
MNRRNFLKGLGVTSMVSTSLGSFVLGGMPSKAHASVSDHFWVFFYAKGGWDVTSMFDPKGSSVISKLGPINNYPSSAIRQIGNIRYAPVPEGINANDQMDVFVKKHYQRLMVINGINSLTNSHTVGMRVAFTGTTAGQVPTMPALLAAPYASSQPMAYIHDGGLNYTGGLVAPSKLLSGDQFSALGVPDRYLDSPSVYQRLRDAKAQQLESLMAQTSDTANDRLIAMRQLQDARHTEAGVDELLAGLPETASTANAKANMEVIAAAFAGGWSTSASVGTGNWDTHHNNDVTQYSLIAGLFGTVDHLWDQLERLGIADKTTIVMVSDMARTPGYNNNAGKDHWGVNSMVLMGAGIKGNRTIGGTDDNQRPLKINPDTLELDGNGIQITSTTVMRALRKLAGMQGGILDTEFPLKAPDIPLFG